MKRRIVQHGPSTLTISLPAKWAKKHGLEKGDELTVEEVEGGLLLATGKGVHLQPKELDVKGTIHLLPHLITALYKRGYDDLMITYDAPEELERIHSVLSAGCIGFEIVEETRGQVRIKKVSEPSQEEFRTLFRRIFYFLLSVADESLEAMKLKDAEMHRKLLLRDQNINKLSDFCRRVVNKKGQTAYRCDTAIYHITEQLEKIGDDYGAINYYLANGAVEVSAPIAQLFERTNKLLREYEKVFFDFSLERMDAFTRNCKTLLNELEKESPGGFVGSRLEMIAIELHNLKGATLVLHL